MTRPMAILGVKMTLLKKIVFLGVFGLLIFFGCSEDSNPFMPENLPENELAYFPLTEGYKADYTYYYRIEAYDGDFQRNGTFSLEVVDELPKVAERKVFYKIRTTFAVDNPNTVTTNEYDVMFAGGSLWYVSNAPSFERLDQGDTTLMMASPIACGGEMNLKIFELSEFRETRLLLTSREGDYCVYQGYIYPVDVTTVKLKGIKRIDLVMSNGATINYRIHRERFELIEQGSGE